ncbi:hypothetical protein [Chitinimonas lacunae]|uniref:Peptidase M61 catalytic domain-containing protein n=1 Tax=Chitinimonas lacunae TaxID=1963018 RepID=A0ABV8MUG0_9NEIS
MKLTALLALALPVCATAAAPVTVELGAKDGDLYVEYQFPADRTFIKFENNRFDSIRRERWKALSDCAVLIDGGLRRHQSERCRKVRFDIIKGTLHLSRTYQLAESISDDHDVMTHTDHFAVDAPQVRWRFRPAKGEIVINDGRALARPVTVRSTSTEQDRSERLSRRYNDALVYFGKPDRVQRWGGTLVVMSKALPPAIETRLSTTHNEAMRDYARAFGPNSHPRALFIKYLPPTGNNADYQRGDVTRNSMIQLSLAVPAEPSAAFLNKLDSLVAHELSHLWNSGQAYSTQNGSQPWLHEGGADWITYAWLRQSNRISEEEYQRLLADQLNRCRSEIGNEPFKGDGNGANGKVAYHCGISLYWLGYLSLRQRQPDLTPLTAVAGFFRRFPAYDDARWIAYFASGNGADLKETVQGVTPFAAALPALLRARGVEVESVPVEAPEFPVVSGQLIGALQSKDCRGSVAFWTHHDHFRTDAMPHCTTLKRSLKIDRVAGVKLLQDPLTAYTKLRAACQQQGASVTLGTLDGETVDVACPDQFTVLTDRLKLRDAKSPHAKVSASQQ